MLERSRCAARIEILRQLLLACGLGGINAVERENVNPQAVAGEVVEVFLHQFGAEVHHFGVVIGVAFRFWGERYETLVGIGKHHFQQLVIIGARHGDVDVVVPRNKPIVADCAQQCAVTQIVAQAVLFAHSHDVIEYLNFLSLNFFAR